MVGLGVCTGLALGAVISGCGSSNSGAKNGVGGSPIQLQITAPSGGSVIAADRTTIRGTVNPPNATVQVVGQPAQVGNGVFTASASLHPGTNTIDVVASAPGLAPTTTSVSVTRPGSPSPRPAPRRSGPRPAPSTPTPAPSPAPGGSTQCGAGVSAGPNTSCGFALNVKAAWDQNGGGTVSVYSPTTGRTYLMSCTSSPPHVCTGANNASVYFP